MIPWFKDLDALLRGRKTGPELLVNGGDGISLRTFSTLAVILGVIYGSFMGWYAISGREHASVQQLIASTVKMPALFLATLIVTFPSLYVFSALIGCRLSFLAVLRLLVATIVINLAVAASLGPILGFFTLSTTSYPFMVVLNVILLTVAGFVGLGCLLRVLRTLALVDRPAPIVDRAVSQEPEMPAPAASECEISSSPELRGRASGRQLAALTAARLARPPADPERSAYGIFYVWVIIYGLVGAQMGWLLRPFIGNPSVEFSWLRPRDGNFFQAVLMHLRMLFDLPG